MINGQFSIGSQAHVRLTCQINLSHMRVKTIAFIFRSTPVFTLNFVRALFLRAYAYSFLYGLAHTYLWKKFTLLSNHSVWNLPFYFDKPVRWPTSPNRFSLMNKEKKKNNDKSNINSPQLAVSIRKCGSSQQQLIGLINLINWRAPPCGEPIRKLI